MSKQSSPFHDFRQSFKRFLDQQGKSDIVAGTGLSWKDARDLIVNQYKKRGEQLEQENATNSQLGQLMRARQAQGLDTREHEEAFAKQSAEKYLDMLPMGTINKVSKVGLPVAQEGLQALHRQLRSVDMPQPRLQFKNSAPNDVNAGLSDTGNLAKYTQEPNKHKYTFIHNTEKAPKAGIDDRFGQKIEPAGKYMNISTPENAQRFMGQDGLKGYEVGTVEFSNPLIVPQGESTRAWKEALSQRYGGKKGKELSKALVEDGYDGIITMEKNGEPSEVISFDKLLPNRVAQPSIDDRELITLHNLGESGLQKAVQMGGLPVPSLAITKADIPFDDFGDISLVGGKNLAENVHNADVYSRRVPSQQFKLNRPEVNKLFKDMEPHFEKTGDYKWGGVYESISDEYRASPKELWRNARDSNALKSMFLQETRGVDIKPVYREVPLDKFGVGRPPKVDEEVIKKQIDEAFQGIDKSEFEEWVKTRFESVYGEPYFRNSRGAKRPYNLDNLVEYMTGRTRGQENFHYGVGSTRSRMAQKFGSVEEIRKAKGQIQSKEESEKIKEELSNEYGAIIDDLTERAKTYSYETNPFTRFDRVSERLGDVGANPTPAKIERVLESMGVDTTPQDVERLNTFFKKLRSAPTSYFEAKPQRAVKVEEFSGMLVPQERLEAIKRLVGDKIKVVGYNADKEGERAKLIKKHFKDSLFTLVPGTGGVMMMQNEQDSPSARFKSRREQLKKQR